MLGGKNMRTEFVSRQQVNLIPERLRKAEETDASKELTYYRWNLSEKKKFKPMNIMVVGAGGSYPAAIFAKYKLQREIKTAAKVEAVTPQTAVRILTQFNNVNFGEWNPKYDLVIGISYSGKTPDIKYVSDICQKGGFPFMLLTGAEKSTLSEIYSESDVMKIVSYFNPEDTTGKERGMISMISTLAPVVIFDDNYTSKLISENQQMLSAAESIVSNLNICDIAKAIKKYPIIHVFYEWDTLPMAADIESKFIESGISNVILNEKKNFSHGRYTSLYNQNFALVINLARYESCHVSEYDQKLSEFLKERCKEKAAQYIKIGKSCLETSEWNIYAMAMLPYLITSIGEELGIDISKPLKPFPSEAKPLFDYKGEF